MNSITFDGRVAADAELRYTPGGDPILGFRVASDIGYGDKKTTNWFACTIWGKRGESLQQYIAKGQQVTVYGQLTLREWTDKDGSKRLSPDVRVSEISLQGGKREDDAGHQATHHAPPPPRRQAAPQGTPGNADELDDDLPF